MCRVEILESVAFFFSLLRDLEKKELTRVCLPFWRGASAGLGAQLFKAVESSFVQLANLDKLRIVTNKEVVKKLLKDLYPCVRVVDERRFLHSKLILIEYSIIYIGSANLTFDRIETTINHVFRIDDHTLHEQLCALFDLLFAISQAL